MSRLRIEFMAWGSARGRLGGQVGVKEAEPIGATTLDVTGVATAGGARPVVPSGQGTVFAELTAIDAPIYVDIGGAPDPTVEPRLLVLPGRPQRVHVLGGTAISAVTAGDIAASIYPTQDQPLALALTDRSGTVTSGGAAQQACAANAGRRMLLLANPDESRGLWFNTTAAAGNAAGSLQVGPGGVLVFDKVVPSGAVSVFGAVVGQPFTVKEA